MRTRIEERVEGVGEVGRGDVGGAGVIEGGARGEVRSEGEDAGEGTTVGVGDEVEEEIAMLDLSRPFLVLSLALPVYLRSPTLCP